MKNDAEFSREPLASAAGVLTALASGSRLNAG
jgi:hypothetical protein